MTKIANDVHELYMAHDEFVATSHIWLIEEVLMSKKVFLIFISFRAPDMRIELF